jgi:Permeases of the drug/metabolite transporter (DMT) superfamily
MTSPRNSTAAGHLIAFATIVFWATTYISTKVLLVSFTPIEILFTRFIIGFIALTLINPKPLKSGGYKNELLFVAAGATGVTLYYLLENFSLTLTTASNAGIIITVAPFFTALLSCIFLKSEKPRAQFYLGFVTAIVGIAIIDYSGTTEFALNPMGDLLALLAAVAWAVYSIITRKISRLGFDTVRSTRKTFMYGLLFMTPMVFIMDFSPDPALLASPVNIGNLLFLGLGASAMCFVTWNLAVKLIGAVKTSVYIYLTPVVTVATSVLILHEPLTPALVFGAALTLAGLWLSETKLFDKFSKKRTAA